MFFRNPPPHPGVPPEKKGTALVRIFFSRAQKCLTIGAKGAKRKFSLMPQRGKEWFFTPCVYTQITQIFQENSIMDEKHIGPNIDTIPA